MLEKSKDELAVYEKKLQKVRALIYVLLTLVFLGTVTPAIDAYKNSNTMPSGERIVQLIMIFALVAVTIASHKKPFISLSILAILIAMGFLLYLLNIVAAARSTVGIFNPLPAIFGITVQGIITFYVFNGAIVAKKFEKLKEFVRSQPDLE